MAIRINEMLDNDNNNNNNNNTNCALPQAKNKGHPAYFGFALNRNILLKSVILVVFFHKEHRGPGSDNGATSVILVVLEKSSHFTHFTEMSSFGLI